MLIIVVYFSILLYLLKYKQNSNTYNYIGILIKMLIFYYFFFKKKNNKINITIMMLLFTLNATLLLISFTILTLSSKKFKLKKIHFIVIIITFFLINKLELDNFVLLKLNDLVRLNYIFIFFDFFSVSWLFDSKFFFFNGFYINIFNLISESNDMFIFLKNGLKHTLLGSNIFILNNSVCINYIIDNGNLIKKDFFINITFILFVITTIILFSDFS